MAAPRSALVSGVTGFVGASLASRLIAEGMRVYGVVRARSSQVYRIETLRELEVVEVSSYSREELRRALAKVRATRCSILPPPGSSPGTAIPTNF